MKYYAPVFAIDNSLSSTDLESESLDRTPARIIRTSAIKAIAGGIISPLYTSYEK